MKLTLDMPSDLVKLVKLRALQEGRTLRDFVADLLRRGLSTPSNPTADAAGPLVTKDKRTGLPIIHCKRRAAPHEELTPERVADSLLSQETDWHDAASR
jgi:hypothetical protein